MLKHIGGCVTVICVNTAISLLSIHAASSNNVTKLVLQCRAQSVGISRAVGICIGHLCVWPIILCVCVCRSLCIKCYLCRNFMRWSVIVCVFVCVCVGGGHFV